MIIKSNKKLLTDYFCNLTNGQLFSIDNLYNENDKSIKRYFIKINPNTFLNHLSSNEKIVNYGYAVDLENGDFAVIKNDTVIILEKGHVMLGDESMKKEIIVCDICGKPIDYKEHRRFKVRMKEFYWARHPFETSKWYKMDVHDECFQELGRLIADARNKKERDYDKLLKNINAFAELVHNS